LRPYRRASTADSDRRSTHVTEPPHLKQKRAQELREAWGDAPCEHPKLAKLYDLGTHTGNFVCIQCGRVFSFREKAELAASRRA
jgi:hypothetical protein